MLTNPSSDRCVKTLNLRVLYRADGGYVVEKIVVEDVGVQVKMHFNDRRGPCCSRCAGGLSRDLPSHAYA